MKKIPTMFIRDFEGKNGPPGRFLTRDPHPACAWVFAGEGVATKKYDGTCCLARDGKLYRRHEVKPGGRVPEGFEPADDVDPETGKQPGWVPVDDGPEDRWHREAMKDTLAIGDGTYELIGPKINSNPERLEIHFLVPHSEAEEYADVPRDFDGLRAWLEGKDIEGLVFHHPDGRMAKIKKKDFGLQRSYLAEKPQ